MVTPEQIRKVFLSLLTEIPDREYVQLKTAVFRPQDWRSLFALSQKTGLLPCFYTNLSRLSLSNIPVDLLSEFKTLFMFNLMKNSVLEKELLGVLGHLKNSSITAIALKGPALSRYIHGDLSLRQASADLDILVCPEERGRAETALKKLGYDFMQSNLKPDFFHNFRTSIMLQRETTEGQSVNLDLHWGFRDRFSPAHIKEFWSYARESVYLQSRITLPSDEDLLIFLSLAAVSDFDFVQPKYLYDIHRLLSFRRETLDWKRIYTQASCYGLRTVMFFSLFLSVNIFKTKIPEESYNRFKPTFLRYAFCKFWMNTRNILSYRERIMSGYLWRYFISSYLLTAGAIQALRRIYKKIFISLEEVRNYHGTVSAWQAFFLYIRRFLKPFYVAFYNS